MMIVNEDKKNLLQAKLYLEYYKKDINDRYQIMLNNFALDNDILNNFNEMLWITTLDKYKQLKQENELLKDKLNDIEKILDADCCVENVYQAICQYLNIHDFELDLEDYLKEN